MPPIPVYVVQPGDRIPVEGNIAIPIYALPVDDVHTPEGAFAQPVYVATAADVLSGRIKVRGDTTPMLVHAVPAGFPLIAGDAKIVYVVGGSFAVSIPNIAPPDGPALRLEDDSGIIILENGNRLILE